MKAARIRRLGIVAGVVALLAAAGAGASGAPRITETKLGEDALQKPDGFEIVRETSVFRPDSPKVACVFRVDGAKLGAAVKGVWFAEDVGSSAPPNYKILEKTLVLPFIRSGSLSITKPDKGWPIGTYRLEIYFGSTLAATVKFTVRAKS